MNQEKKQTSFYPTRLNNYPTQYESHPSDILTDPYFVMDYQKFNLLSNLSKNYISFNRSITVINFGWPLSSKRYLYTYPSVSTVWQGHLRIESFPYTPDLMMHAKPASVNYNNTKNWFDCIFAYLKYYYLFYSHKIILMNYNDTWLFKNHFTLLYLWGIFSPSVVLRPLGIITWNLSIAYGVTRAFRTSMIKLNMQCVSKNCEQLL